MQKNDKYLAYAEPQGVPEELLYEVDEDDHIIGSISRSKIHTAPMPIHRANGIFAVTEDKRVIFQVRALFKNTFPGAIDIHGGNVKFGVDYDQSAYEEFHEEVPIKISRERLVRLYPLSNPFFKIRVPSNRENKAIYFVLLTKQEEKILAQKSVEIYSLWQKVYQPIAERMNITIEELRYKARLSKHGDIRAAVGDELRQQIGKHKLDHYEVENYVTMDIEQALQKYYQQPDLFADGFYSLFDTNVNKAKEAMEYPQLILKQVFHK